MIYEIPSKVIYGDSKYEIVKQVINEKCLRKVLIITDKTLVTLGIIDTVIRNLELDDFIIESGVMTNPNDIYVNQVAKKYRSQDFDMLLAIGGGSVIDAAKSINILLTNLGDICDYEKRPANKPGLNLIAFPTTSGTASEVTSVSVITHSQEKRKMVIMGEHMSADIAVLDAALTYDLPKQLTISTSMDALTHAIEAYVSLFSSVFTDVHAIKAIEDILAHIRDYDNQHSREVLMYASTMAGFAFNNAILGLAHAIAHPLGAHFDVPHGLANAIVLPQVIKYNYDSSDKFKKIEELLGIADLYQYLKELNRDLDIPPLAEYIHLSDFELIAEEALKEPSIMMNPKKVTKDAIIKILENS